MGKHRDDHERAKGEKTPGETPGRNWFGESGKYIWGLSCFLKWTCPAIRLFSENFPITIVSG